jgi:hypothetical protein
MPCGIVRAPSADGLREHDQYLVFIPPSRAALRRDTFARACPLKLTLQWAMRERKWAHQDSNLGQAGYEPELKVYPTTEKSSMNARLS